MRKLITVVAVMMMSLSLSAQSSFVRSYNSMAYQFDEESNVMMIKTVVFFSSENTIKIVRSDIKPIIYYAVRVIANENGHQDFKAYTEEGYEIFGQLNEKENSLFIKYNETNFFMFMNVEKLKKKTSSSSNEKREV